MSQNKSFWPWLLLGAAAILFFFIKGKTFKVGQETKEKSNVRPSTDLFSVGGSYVEIRRNPQSVPVSSRVPSNPNALPFKQEGENRRPTIAGASSSYDVVVDATSQYNRRTNQKFVPSDFSQKILDKVQKGLQPEIKNINQLNLELYD